MVIGDLSFESPPSLRVTWSIPDFFRVAEKSACSLRSPDFTFADGRHSLRLFKGKYKGHDCIAIELLNLTDSDPVVLCEVQVSRRTGEINGLLLEDYKHVFLHTLIYLENHRDEGVPDGTLTVLCSVRRPTKPSRAGSPESGGAKARVIPQCRTSIGELSFQSFPFLYVTWTIPGLIRLSRESKWNLESPEFPFSDSRCRLRLFWSSDDVYMQLVDLADTVNERYVSCDAGLKLTTGEEIYRRSLCTETKGFLFSLRELAKKKCAFFPDGNWTVFCCVRSTEPNSTENPESGGAESQVVPGSKAATHLKSVAVQTSKDEEGREELPGSKAAAAHLKSVAVQTSEEDPEALTGGVAKLQSDYKRLLLKGAESDACLLVCDKEFQAHKCVLRARSPVFEAMFDHETSEKASGRVVINDLNPDRFEDFMEYVYTGRVESFCDDNAFGLYAAADKYDLPTLKSECVEYMRRGLSVDNFCDVLTLALRHHERDLLELAVEFFKKNVAAILSTVKWQQFICENGIRANELLLKLHVPGRESDDVLLP